MLEIPFQRMFIIFSDSTERGWGLGELSCLPYNWTWNGMFNLFCSFISIYNFHPFISSKGSILVYGMMVRMTNFSYACVINQMWCDLKFYMGNFVSIHLICKIVGIWPDCKLMHNFFRFTQLWDKLTKLDNF